MKINKLEKNPNGDIVNLDIDMTNEENAFFVGFAFNALMTQGLLRINEQTKAVEFRDTPTENKVS